MTQKLLPLQLRSTVFACTKASQEECFKRLLVGSNKVYGAVAMRVKKGDFLFLWNLDSDFLYGVFRAERDAEFNAIPEAWDGKYPYQVKVEPVGKITPLKEAKKLLDSLKIVRSSPINRSKTIALLELCRPPSLSINQWFERLVQTEAGKGLEISSEAKLWSLLPHVNKTDMLTEELPTLQSTTLWDFPRQNYGSSPKGNNKYAGVTPAEIIWNLIWRYTEPGDLVVDPMCGSGTTIDVCREEGRKAICYDISPPLLRRDILKNDARKIPLPDNHVDMVFVDSPYGDNIRYNEDPNCIGKISSETAEFYDELEKVIQECHRILKTGKVLGWLIGDQWVKKKFTPVGFLLYARLTKYFDTVDLICVTRRNQSSNTGIWANRARRFNFYLRGFKYLFIMRKPIPNQNKLEESRKINWAYYQRARASLSKTSKERKSHS